MCRNENTKRDQQLIKVPRTEHALHKRLTLRKQVAADVDDVIQWHLGGIIVGSTVVNGHSDPEQFVWPKGSHGAGV